MGALFIAFDSNFFFEKKEYYFCYQNITFKLLSGNREYKHLLITIVDNHEDETYKKIYQITSEFLSAFNWEHPYCKFLFTGDIFGVGACQKLEKLGRQSKSPKELWAYLGSVDLPQKIPFIQNDRIKNIFALFREAKTASDALPLYEFFCYWKIFELLHKTNNPSENIYNLIGWKFFQKKGFRSKKQIFTYLKEQLRNALYHGYRKSKLINPDNFDDVYEIKGINSKIKKCIRRHIDKNININNYLHLFSLEKEKYPIYMTEGGYVNKKINLIEIG